MSHTPADSAPNQSSVPVRELSPKDCVEICLVPHLVAAQAMISPDAIAVVQGNALLTYKELNQRADRLACFLQSAGVRPDVVVGIYLNRSLAMLVAALAIMKAGGAYLPLDPHYPIERLIFMLNDAQAPLVVTAECLREALPVQSEQMVVVDAEGRFSSEIPARLLVAYEDPENL